MSTPGPASVIATATREAVQAGGTISDPIDRADAYEQALANTRGLTTELAAQRRAAIIEARSSRSVQAIADELGLTRARVYQIIDNA